MKTEDLIRLMRKDIAFLYDQLKEVASGQEQRCIELLIQRKKTELHQLIKKAKA